MRILVTGVSGYVGAALVPRLQAAGHEVRGFARSPERVARRRRLLDDLVVGDAVSGAGLGRALDGVGRRLLPDPLDGGPGRQRLRRARAPRGRALRHRRPRGRRAPGRLPRRARAADSRTLSRHLASRLAVEEALLEAADEPIALRASIVVGARSRSFRFLVRLIERLPVLALPAWREHRTQPIDGRDVLDFLVAAADAPAALAGRSYDIAGPDLMTYQELIERIAEAMLVERPAIRLGFSLTPVAARGRRRRRGRGPGLHHAAHGVARERPPAP